MCGMRRKGALRIVFTLVVLALIFGAGYHLGQRNGGRHMMGSGSYGRGFGMMQGRPGFNDGQGFGMMRGANPLAPTPSISTGTAAY